MRYKINEEEKARAKYFLDRLAPLGGFIEEEAELKMVNVYPSDLVSLVKKHCKSGKEFLLVVEKVVDIRNQISEREYNDAEVISDALTFEQNFEKWFMEQNILAELEQLENPDLTAKDYPEMLSALEKKLLELYIGKNLELAELADAMECKENDEYVVMILHYMKKRMASENCEIKKLNDRLTADNLELDW